MGKGEIAHYEQFLLFPQCFQKARFPGASKGVIVWEWVKIVEVLQLGRKHCWKRRNCSLRAIFPFPTVCTAQVSLKVWIMQFTFKFVRKTRNQRGKKKKRLQCCPQFSPFPCKLPPPPPPAKVIKIWDR